MRKDHKANKQTCSLSYPTVRHEQASEPAAGTGLIARHIVFSAYCIKAVDASPVMIEQEKQIEKMLSDRTIFLTAFCIFTALGKGRLFDFLIIDLLRQRNAK